MKTIRDLLSGRAPVTCPGTATVLDAAKKMDECRIGALIVVDAKGPVGVFTERDLMNRVVVPELDPKTLPVAKVMSKNVFSTTPDQRINDVARELQERHIRHVPVIEDGKLLGMLSLRDLLREHLQLKRGEVAALTAYIQGEGEGPAAELA
jgi:CBS domain-containing protein